MSNDDIPDLSKVIIRPSSLADASDCARRNAAANFKNDIKAAGFTLRERMGIISAKLGTAAHHGIAELLRKKQAGQKEEFKDVLASSIDNFEKGIKDGVETDDTTPNADTGIKQLANILRVYAISILPKIQPKLIEHKVTYPLGDNYFLEGTLDAYDHSDWLHDVKTGGTDKNHILQMGSYTLGLREQGEDPQGAQADWIKRTPLSAKAGQAPAKYETYDVDKAAIAAFAYAHRIKADHRHFLETGNEWSFMPSPDSNLCSEKYCPAWGTNFCSLWREKK